MNVLVVFHDSLLFSGATKSMSEIVESWLKSSDINVALLFPDEGPAYRLFKERTPNVFACKYYNSRVPVSKRNHLFELIKGFLKRKISARNVQKCFDNFIIKRFPAGFDYIYSNTGSIYCGYDLAKAKRIKHVWHIREYGLLDQERVHYNGEHAFVKTLDSSKMVICISNDLRDYLSRLGKKIDNAIVVYNDVNTGKKVERNRPFEKKNAYTLLSCGGIQKNKGHLTVIKALENLLKERVNVSLKIAGDTSAPYFRELNDYVLTNELSRNVEFLGFVENMDSIRQVCDIAVVASTSEAFGRVTIEAMQKGLHVIGANSGGTKELIEDGKTGRLFSSGNAIALKERIMSAINDPISTNEMIENALVFSSYFSSGRAAVTILNFLKRGECVTCK